MPSYSLTHLADSKLSQDLRSGVGDDRATLAMRLTQIAEFDRRRLYLPAYPSMDRAVVSGAIWDPAHGLHDDA